MHVYQRRIKHTLKARVIRQIACRYNLRGTSTLAVLATTGAGSLCTSAAASSSGGSRSSSGSNVFVVGVDGPDPASPSAAGCTVFSPLISELSLDAPPLSSSSLTAPNSSTAGTDAADGVARYGVVFSGHFSGMTTLYGSVSLHVSFEDAGVIESLPDPATVDLALEACAGGPTAAVAEGVGGVPDESGGEGGVVELEWGTCEDGWQPVLFQVRQGAVRQGWRVCNSIAAMDWSLFEESEADFRYYVESIYGAVSTVLVKHRRCVHSPRH